MGSFQTEQSARTFHDTLLSRGIESTTEDEDGVFAIWVHDDDRLSESSKLMEEFRASPDAAVFREATVKASQVRGTLEKSNVRQRATVVDEARVGYERQFAGASVVTILLIVITAAFAVYGGFMRSRSADRAFIDRMHISEAPFIKASAGGPRSFFPRCERVRCGGSSPQFSSTAI